MVAALHWTTKTLNHAWMLLLQDFRLPVTSEK